MKEKQQALLNKHPAVKKIYVLIDEGKSHDILGGLKEISRILLKRKLALY